MHRPVSGNGDICPLNPEHGRMWMLDANRGDSRQFCPDASHSSAKPPERAVWEHDGMTPALGPRSEASEPRRHRAA